MNIPQKVSLAVIGGGITGLSTAIAWALNNPAASHPVCVFEKEPHVGGYVTSFRRKGYVFDTVQIIPDSKELLDYFGVDRDLVSFGEFYARIFLVDPQTHKSRCIRIPSGFDSFRDLSAQIFSWYLAMHAGRDSSC